MTCLVSQRQTPALCIESSKDTNDFNPINIFKNIIALITISYNDNKRMAASIY